MYHSFWIQSFADGHLGCFQHLTIVNCAAMNIGVHRFFWIVVSGLLGKDLNISHNTIKVLEENIGRKISDIPCSNIFTDTSPKARDIKERINKWDLIKIESFCMAKENTIKMKREPTVWENIFANDTSDKALICKIYKEFTRTSTPGRQTIQLKNGQRT